MLWTSEDDNDEKEDTGANVKEDDHKDDVNIFAHNLAHNVDLTTDDMKMTTMLERKTMSMMLSMVSMM